ncbi:MAG: OmpA family protein [Boseongicola sp.]
MFDSSVRIISTLLCAAALTGCGAPSEISRSATVLQVPQPAALTALSLKFRSETPFLINFGFDLDALDEESRGNLDLQAEWILAHPNVKFRVYGHADKVGNSKYNDDLGMRRATTAVNYLVAKGINVRRLEAVVSYGEDAPVINTEDRERANRRVVTDVFAFITPVKGEGQDLVVASVTIADSFTEPTPTSDPVQEPQPEPEQDSGSGDDGGKNPNSGRGNGDESGDPGKSEGKNNGGDE